MKPVRLIWRGLDRYTGLLVIQNKVCYVAAILWRMGAASRPNPGATGFMLKFKVSQLGLVTRRGMTGIKNDYGEAIR